jgi:hypothetical protein
VRFEPLAETQSSSAPVAQASCWVDQLWSSEPSHWARVSAPAKMFPEPLLRFHGYCRPEPLGWLKTL